MQDCSIFIANALEILQPSTKPSKCNFPNQNMNTSSFLYQSHINATIQWSVSITSSFHKKIPATHPIQTETEMSLLWWNFHHWVYWKLSKWQLPVHPVMKFFLTMITFPCQCIAHSHGQYMRFFGVQSLLYALYHTVVNVCSQIRAF